MGPVQRCQPYASVKDRSAIQIGIADILNPHSAAANFDGSREDKGPPPEAYRAYVEDRTAPQLDKVRRERRPAVSERNEKAQMGYFPLGLFIYFQN